jgi:hypothetical protein
MLATGDQGGEVAEVRYFVSGFWLEIQIFKYIFGLRPNDKRDPCLLAVACLPQARGRQKVQTRLGGT